MPSSNPPEGLDQRRWDILVGDIDSAINKGMRSRLYDKDAVANTIFVMEKDGEGKDIFMPLFSDDQKMDKYDRAKAIYDSVRSGKRVAFLKPNFSEKGGQRTANKLSVSAIEKNIKEIDIPEETTLFSLKSIYGKRPEKPAKPDASKVDAEKKLFEALVKSWAPHELSGIKKFLHAIFPFAFRREFEEYDRAWEAIKNSAEYLAKLEAVKSKEQDYRNMERDYPGKMEKYQKELQQYNDREPMRDATKNALKNSVDMFNERNMAEVARMQTKPEDPKLDSVFTLNKQVTDDKRIEDRINRMMGASGMQAHQEMRPMKRYEPPKGLPAEVGDEWCALTFGSLGDLDLYQEVHVDSSKGFACFDKAAPEEHHTVVEQANMQVMIMHNILSMDSVDSRCTTLEIPFAEARERADKAWKAYANGDPEPAAKLLKEAFEQFVPYTRSIMIGSDPDRPCGIVMKHLSQCAEKYPELAKDIDPKMLQEARGHALLSDQIFRTRKLSQELVNTPDLAPDRKREMLTEILATKIIAAASNAYTTQQQNTDEYLEARSKIAIDAYYVLKKDKEISPPETIMTIGKNGVGDMLKKVAQTPQHSKKLEELMKLSPSEYAEKLNTVGGEIRNEIYANVSPKKNKEVKIKQNAPQKQTEKAVQKAEKQPSVGMK